ncbi:MAG: UDP-N-acetylmuramate dehydrogenase [bacterium]|nr:UDP-N-acetylmuramate dehydrogenase [bacterium]
MMEKAFQDRLLSTFQGVVKFQEPLKNHTSFGIGGPADCLAEVRSLDELRTLISLAREFQQPVFILGKGSNLLVRDGGIRGVVIRLAGEFAKVMVREGDMLAAGSASLISSLLRVSIQHRLIGLEFATGIPGTLGGALCMNAGTAEEGIGSLVKEVAVVYEDGSLATLSGEKLHFSYRRSCLPPPGGIITSAILHLPHAEQGDDILARIRERYLYRLRSQPLRERSAGCIFKNPPGESAGRLIDWAGLKGVSIGGAQVSTRHGNFIINRQGATCADVLRLIELIREKVYQSFGLILETEVLVVGEG